MNLPPHRASRRSPNTGSGPGEFRKEAARPELAKLVSDGKAVTPELLTDAQLAERWQLSRGTLANQRCQGRGPAYLKIAGRVRYRLSDIEAFEQAGFVQPPQVRADTGAISRQAIEFLIRSAGA
jgi:hypothetical protein